MSSLPVDCAARVLAFFATPCDVQALLEHNEELRDGLATRYVVQTFQGLRNRSRGLPVAALPLPSAMSDLITDQYLSDALLALRAEPRLSAEDWAAFYDDAFDGAPTALWSPRYGPFASYMIYCFQRLGWDVDTLAEALSHAVLVASDPGHRLLPVPDFVDRDCDVLVARGGDLVDYDEWADRVIFAMLGSDGHVLPTVAHPHIAGSRWVASGDRLLWTASRERGLTQEVVLCNDGNFEFFVRSIPNSLKDAVHLRHFHMSNCPLPSFAGAPANELHVLTDMKPSLEAVTNLTLRYLDSFGLLKGMPHLHTVQCRATTSAVKVVGNGFLAKCPKLHSVIGLDLSRVTNIGPDLLNDCTALTCIDGLKLGGDISWGCLQGCTALTRVTTLDVTKVTNGLQGFLSCCSSLVEVDGIDFSNMPCTPNAAFHDCRSLRRVRNVILSATVGNDFMLDCTSLESLDGIDFTSVVTVWNQAFCGCTSLTHVELLDLSRIGTVGNNFMRRCTGLRSVGILKLPTNVRDDFMSLCSSLEIIEGMDASKCTHIGSSFLRETALKALPALDFTRVKYAASYFFADNACLRLTAPMVLPQHIEAYAFYGCARDFATRDQLDVSRVARLGTWPHDVLAEATARYAASHAIESVTSEASL